jgi:hypothetical protein
MLDVVLTLFGGIDYDDDDDEEWWEINAMISEDAVALWCWERHYSLALLPCTAETLEQRVRAPSSHDAHHHKRASLTRSWIDRVDLWGTSTTTLAFTNLGLARESSMFAKLYNIAKDTCFRYAGCDDDCWK